MLKFHSSSSLLPSFFLPPTAKLHPTHKDHNSCLQQAGDTGHCWILGWEWRTRDADRLESFGKFFLLLSSFFFLLIFITDSTLFQHHHQHPAAATAGAATTVGVAAAPAAATTIAGAAATTTAATTAAAAAADASRVRWCVLLFFLFLFFSFY